MWLTLTRSLEPGGWLELQELSVPVSDDGTMGPETSLYQAAKVMRDGAAAAGRPFVDLYTLKDMLRKAGFINIVEKRLHWPSNPWPRDPKLKEIAGWNNANVKSGLEAFLIAFGTRMLGWSADEVRILSAKAWTDSNDRKIHSYWPVVVVYGQKPEGTGKAQA